MNTYDAILVLGKSIRADGDLQPASKAMVEKAVELFNAGVAPKVIFSGKWYFQLDPQPVTEAAVMAAYAKDLGLPESAIILEEDSDATVANIYFTKVNILEKNRWRRIIMPNFYPFIERAMMTARKILGPDYVVDVAEMEFRLHEPKHCEYVEEEKRKVHTMTEFYKQFEDGDHQAVYKAHLQYLKDHGFLTDSGK